MKVTPPSPIYKAKKWCLSMREGKAQLINIDTGEAMPLTTPEEAWREKETRIIDILA